MSQVEEKAQATIRIPRKLDNEIEEMRKEMGLTKNACILMLIHKGMKSA